MTIFTKLKICKICTNLHGIENIPHNFFTGMTQPLMPKRNLSFIHLQPKNITNRGFIDMHSFICSNIKISTGRKIKNSVCIITNRMRNCTEVLELI